MNGEARKLHLIEALLKVEDESKLREIEALLLQVNASNPAGKKPADYAGIWTEEEADEIKRYIEEGHNFTNRSLPSRTDGRDEHQTHSEKI